MTTSVIENYWNACQATLEGHSGDVTSVAFSPDSKSIASASSEGAVKIWDAISGNCKLTIKVDCRVVQLLAFSPNSQYLASVSSGTIKIWGTTTGLPMGNPLGPEPYMASVTFSPDSTWLASTTYDGAVEIRDIKSGHSKLTLQCDLDLGLARLIAFLSDGQRLAVACIDGFVIYNLETGEGRAHHHRSEVIMGGRALSAGGRYLALRNIHATMVLDIIRLCSVSEIDNALGEPLAFSPDGQYLALVSNGTINIWDIKTGQCAAAVQPHLPHNDMKVAFSPNSRYLASSSLHGTVRIWDITRSGHEKEKVEDDCRPFRSLNLSPCTQYIASVGEDETVKLWDDGTGCWEVALRTCSHRAPSTSFSPNGKILAVSSGDLVEIWDPVARSCNATLKRDVFRIHSVAFSPDNRHLALSYAGGSIKIWDTLIGRYTVTLSPDLGRVLDFFDLVAVSFHQTAVSLSRAPGPFSPAPAFSPNGRLLASASYKQIQIFDALIGDHKATINSTTSFKTICFDKTGALLTNTGAFDLSVPTVPVAIVHVHGHLSQSDQRKGYGISEDGVWITYQGRNLLWLPSEYRTSVFAIVGSTVALGCADGRILRFRFSGM